MNDALSLTAPQVEAMNEQDAEAALGAWVKARRSELPEALAASKSRVHAKLAKKALYALRSLGLQVEAPKTLPALPTPIETPTEELPAVLSAILGTGERAVFFVRPARAGGGLDVYQGIINDERGVTQLESGTAKRSTYRKRIAELQADPTLKVLLVPWERMRLELGRALTMNERSMTAAPAQTMDLLRVLQVQPESPDWEVPAAMDGDVALAATAATLHIEPELNQWLPSEPAIAELGKKLADLELKPEPLAEEASARAHQIAAEYLTPQRRKTYARRLWSMAELFEKSGRAHTAELARAEARLLFHGTGPSRFVEAMFDAVVARRRDALEQARASVKSGAGRLGSPALSPR